MKQATLTLPEIGAIAATRGMAGAGLGLLLASKMTSENRKKLGWRLLALGALTTIPLVYDLVRKTDPRTCR